MFKMKRAQPEESRQDTPAEIQGSKIDNDDSTAQTRSAEPRAEGLKSKVPLTSSPKRRQTAAPDGATIRQQFEAVRRYAAEPGAGFSLQPRRTTAEEISVASIITTICPVSAKMLVSIYLISRICCSNYKR